MVLCGITASAASTESSELSKAQVVQRVLLLATRLGGCVEALQVASMQVQRLRLRTQCRIGFAACHQPQVGNKL